MYWKQLGTNQSVILSTCTIVHKFIEVSDIKNVAVINIIICNKKQARQAVHRQPIFISDSEHDYILEKIERRDYIEYERKIHNDDK